MDLKQLIIFGIENSQEPEIKNPVLRAALEGPSITAQEPRMGLAGGQLVQPGPLGVRQGYSPKSQKLRKPEMRRQATGLKPHEVTGWRRLIKERAEKRGIRLPDFENYPGRGYPSDYADGQKIAKDIKRRLVGSQKTDIKKIGTGSGSEAETLLSKADQDKIKKRFGSKYEGEWDFSTKGKKTGNKFGLPKKGNEKLYQTIVNYIKGTHGPNFAFDTFDSANYHLVQMHRAANLKVNPNKNYVPIYSTKGIIGYIDKTQKGKEYYHADYTGLNSKGKNALLINKHHPDAAELNKLINIVEGTKQEYDDILRPLFKKHGFETPSLNQLIDALLETEGRYDIASSIEKHHQYGVGRQPGKIQLVTRDMNQLATLVEGRVSAGKMDLKLADRILKPSGVQIVVDGQKIGADIAPEKQIKDWKKWVRRKTLADPSKIIESGTFKEIVNNSRRGGALLTHNILNKGDFKPKCKTKFASGGGGLCGKAFADKFPQEYLEEVMKDLKATKYLQSKEALAAGRSFLNKAIKVGSWANPLTLVGGEAWYSVLAGYNEWGKGASLNEAVNEGLWFIPGKHSRDLDMLLGPETKGKAGRNLPVISDEVRGQFDLLTQLGGLINEEGALSGQLFGQQLETGRLEDVKAKSLWEERFDPEKAFAPEKSAEDIKLDYDNMKGDIQWSKDIITPQIEERLKNVMTEGEDVVQKYQAADPTGQSYPALQDKIKDFIVNKYNKGRTFDLADPYSGPVWNWMKRSFEQANPWSDEGLTKRQEELDYLKLTGQLKDQSITKENIPPELIENFLSKFPEYRYVFEGAEGGIASLKKKW